MLKRYLKGNHSITQIALGTRTTATICVVVGILPDSGPWLRIDG